MASRNQRKKKRTNAGNSGNHQARTGQQSRGSQSRGPRGSGGDRVLRSSTETKSSLRTTELVAYVATVLAIVMAALAIDADGPGADPFGAVTAVRYITYLTIGYMVARGLAKAGSWRTDRHDSTDELDSTDEEANAHDGAHDPNAQAETPMDATGEGGSTATSHPPVDATSTGEPDAVDAADPGASGADAPADLPSSPAPAGEGGRR